MDNLINFDGEEGEIHSSNTKSQTNPSELPLLPLCAIAADDQSNTNNNPFDELQKMAETLDPFEIVEQEVKKSKSMPAEVKLEKLLSLTDDSITVDNEVALLEGAMSPALEMTNNRESDMCSPIIHLGFSSDLENESPPAGVLHKWTPDSTDSPLTGTDGTNRGGIKKCSEYRKRLLKLSISNSNNNSPLSINSTTANEIKLTDNKDELQFSIEERLAIKQDQDFEADLQLLTLPILEHLRTTTGADQAEEKNVEQTCDTSNLTCQSNVKPHLESLREKLHCKRQEANHKDIQSLINNLKSLIHDIDMMGNEKKQHANELLDLLRKDLSTDQLNVPQPIVRQGTFDIELQENDEQKKDKNQRSETGVCVTKTLEKTTDVMNFSSATFDCETASADNGELMSLVKKVEPTAQHPSPLFIETTPPPDMPVNFDELIEQIGKVLEGQLHVAQSSSEGSAVTPPVTQTVIVVMNTPQANCTPQTAEPASRNEYDHEDNYIRRRSQSVTLHDKMRILTLPRPVPRPADPLPMESPPITEVDFKTPAAKPIQRRNSFSAVKSYTRIGTPINTADVKPTQIASDTKSVFNYQRGPRPLETHHENPMQIRGGPAAKSAFAAFKPDMRSRYRPDSSAVSMLKSSAPLKATVPIKKVAPFTKPAPASTINANSDISNLNSSIHFLRRAGEIPCTSTPTSRRSGRVDISAVFASKPSTASGVHISPLKRLSTSRTSVYAAYREKPRSMVQNKKILTTELKSKSPVKPRKSAVHFPVSASKAKQSPTGTHTKSTNANTGSAENRVGTFGFRSRSFSHGSAGFNRNKENEK